MSAETSTWLNTRTLQGFTAKRGSAWHRNDMLQAALGAEPNHYDGAIPEEDIHRRLLNWKLARAEKVTAEYRLITGEDADGNPIYGKTVKLPAPNHIAMARPAGAFGGDDPGEVFDFFKGKSYATHDYSEWTINALKLITDGGLSISSAGLLKGGAVFWVQAEMEDNVEVEGVPGLAFRPFITAATSANGWIATTYMTGSQVIVCDNTLSAAIREPKAAVLRVRHSAKSLARVGEVRDALGIIRAVSEDFTHQVNALLDTTFNDKQWDRFLSEQAGLVDDKGKKKELLPMHAGRAEKKLATLQVLAKDDDRVAPWAKTGFGAVQLVNTFQHHLTGVQGDGDRLGRNMMRQLMNEWDRTDNDTLQRVEVITRKKVNV